MIERKHPDLTRGEAQLTQKLNEVIELVNKQR
jgi:hypothetical protein